MVKAKLYNQKGEQKGDVELNPGLFEVRKREGLIKQAIVTILANRRQVIAHTKDRSEVRGGGKKPWKQKGTGRARHGSSRSPIWIGGGVTFGPTKERNFSKDMNKKMRRKALLMCLSDKALDEKVGVLETLEMSAPRTKEIKGLLSTINLKNVLFVVESMDENVVKSVRNLEKVDIMTANSLNTFDVLKYKNILFTKGGLVKAEEFFLKK